MTTQAKIDREAIFELVLMVQDARNEAWTLLNGANQVQGECERTVLVAQIAQMDQMITDLCRA